MSTATLRSELRTDDDLDALEYRAIHTGAIAGLLLGVISVATVITASTNFNATRHGLHKMTLEGRETGVIGDGVNEEGEVNDVVVFPVQPFWEVVRSKGLVEPVVYDGGYWKLRQITIGYDFSKFLPETFPVKGVRLSLVANNVAMLKKWAPNIDPESFSYTSDNVVGLESPSVPTTRSIGFNLNVKF